MTSTVRAVMWVALASCSVAIACGGAGPAKQSAEEPGSRVVVTGGHKCGWIVDKVYFELGATGVQDHQRPVVAQTARMFRCQHGECSAFRVVVEGHASAGEDRPIELGAARAATVVEALVEGGVRREMLRVESKGAQQPVDGADTDWARAKNRRVEFRVDSAGCE